MRGRVPLPRAVATATAQVIALRDAPTAALKPHPDSPGRRAEGTAQPTA